MSNQDHTHSKFSKPTSGDTPSKLLDDPRLTAYALGELEGAERVAFEAELSSDIAAQKAIKEIQAFSKELEVALVDEPVVAVAPAEDAGLEMRTEEQRVRETEEYWENVRSKRRQRESDSPRAVRFPYFLVSSFGVACFAVVFFVFLRPNLTKSGRDRQYVEFALSPTAATSGNVAYADGSQSVADAPTQDSFLNVARHPNSVFPVKVDTTCFDNMREEITRGIIPLPTSVRINELINSFAYDYASPKSNDLVPFAVSMEVADAPWNPEHRLVRIGIKTSDVEDEMRADARRALASVATDVRLNVEFNPAQALSYRFLGYEGTPAKAAGAPAGDSENLTRGQTVTALYEVVPVSTARVIGDSASQAIDAAATRNMDKAGELLTLKIRYKEPMSDVNKRIEIALDDSGRSFAESSDDFKFASAVAGFGLLLSNAADKGSASFDQVLAWATEGASGDYDNARRGAFIDVVRHAKLISTN